MDQMIKGSKDQMDQMIKGSKDQMDQMIKRSKDQMIKIYFTNLSTPCLAQLI